MGILVVDVGETSSASILNIGGVRVLRLLRDESAGRVFPRTVNLPKGLGAARSGADRQVVVVVGRQLAGEGGVLGEEVARAGALLLES